jgi:hypothetical protein
MFHLVLGDEVLVGMSDARFERVFRVRRATSRTVDPEDDLPEPVPMREEVRVFTPPRLITVPSLLVGELLSAHQLHTLGVHEDVLAAWGIRAAGLGATLRGLTRMGWRAPSEVEWEFAVRAAMDSLDDSAPPVQPAMRFLTDMGARVELCRDSWHADWTGAPLDPGGWGDGHEVLRGGGGGASFAWWTAPAAWAECIWPARRSVTSSTRPLAIRPFVSF